MPHEGAARVVLIDNRDSYTFNLVAQLQVAGAHVQVMTNDDPALHRLGSGDLDALVIGPGPGSPVVGADVGGVPSLVGRLGAIPVLGVCLGHQLLASLAGAAVVEVEPSHGHVATITHDGTGLLAGLPSPFHATRYHSLAVLPAAGIDITAHAEDGVAMALVVRQRPWWGVQFHPESIATEHGDRIIDNFLAEVAR